MKETVFKFINLVQRPWSSQGFKSFGGKNCGLLYEIYKTSWKQHAVKNSSAVILLYVQLLTMNDNLGSILLLFASVFSFEGRHSEVQLNNQL